MVDCRKMVEEEMMILAFWDGEWMDGSERNEDLAMAEIRTRKCQCQSSHESAGSGKWEVGT